MDPLVWHPLLFALAAPTAAATLCVVSYGVAHVLVTSAEWLGGLRHRYADWNYRRIMRKWRRSCGLVLVREVKLDAPALMLSDPDLRDGYRYSVCAGKHGLRVGDRLLFPGESALLRYDEEGFHILERECAEPAPPPPVVPTPLPSAEETYHVLPAEKTYVDDALYDSRDDLDVGPTTADLQAEIDALRADLCEAKSHRSSMWEALSREVQSVAAMLARDGS